MFSIQNILKPTNFVLKDKFVPGKKKKKTPFLSPSVFCLFPLPLSSLSFSVSELSLSISEKRVRQRRAQRARPAQPNAALLARQFPDSSQRQGREGPPIPHGRRRVPRSQEGQADQSQARGARLVQCVESEPAWLWTQFVFEPDRDVRGERAEEEAKGFDGEFQ